MTVRAGATRVFAIGAAAFISLLCTATTAAADTQPTLPELEPPADLGAAPTIATAITIGVVAITTLARAARNYLNGRERAKISGRVQG